MPDVGGTDKPLPSFLRSRAHGGVDLRRALPSHYFASNRDGMDALDAVTIVTDLAQSYYKHTHLNNL